MSGTAKVCGPGGNGSEDDPAELEEKEEGDAGPFGLYAVIDGGDDGDYADEAQDGVPDGALGPGGFATRLFECGHGVEVFLQRLTGEL